MGEKLLARRFLRLLRDNNGQSSKVARALVEWAGDQREWLWPNKEWPSTPTDNAIRWDSLPVLAGLVDEAGQEPELFKYVDAVAALLEFDGFERELLRVVAAMERLPRLAALHVKLSNSGEDMLSLMGLFAGAGIADSGRRVRRSGPVSLGLLVPSSDTGGGLQLSLHWRLARILDEGSSDEAHLIEILTGIRQQAELGPEDFKEQGETFSLLRRLLGGALRNRAVGINILIHGPPGTGKTEFARTLAADIGASLFAVGEFDCDGEEPSRYERLHALKWSQHLLARRGESLVLFDEMEDLFAEANSVAGGGRRRAGSKIFVNRLLEANPVPTIWTSNEIDSIDPAHLRRMSFVFRMATPRRPRKSASLPAWVKRRRRKKPPMVWQRCFRARPRRQAWREPPCARPLWLAANRRTLKRSAARFWPACGAAASWRRSRTASSISISTSPIRRWLPW